MFAPLQDLKLFNAVELDTTFGTIQWPNGADFDPETFRWMEWRRRQVEDDDEPDPTSGH